MLCNQANGVSMFFIVVYSQSLLRIYMKPQKLLGCSEVFGLNYIFLFTVGSVTCVVLTNSGIDAALQNTYYVEAHSHCVLSINF